MGLASSFRGIFIIYPRSPAIPFISEKEVGKRSESLRSRSVT